MAKQSRTTAKSNGQTNTAKLNNSGWVIKSSPAKTTLSKDTIRNAVLTVRNAK